MALSGQLSDLSLAELIEFFCNQHKSGRLRVSYPQAPGFFYFQKGMLVDAKIGALNGVEAVYYALTLENASFNFSASFEPSRRVIHQPWAQVALEGLRRMDEGITPPEAFPDGYRDSYMDDADGSKNMDAAVEVAVEESVENAVEVADEGVIEPVLPRPTPVRKERYQTEVPLGLAVEHASGDGRRGMFYAAIVTAVLISIAAVGFPAGWYSRKQAPKVSQPLIVPNETRPLADVNGDNSTAVDTSLSGGASTSVPSDADVAGPVSESPAVAARRQRAASDHWKAAEEKPNTTSAKPGATTASSAAPNDSAKKPETVKPKTTTVQVSYDEAGRVTQASGGDANALRIARQKRFPPGKAGSATVTIPVN